MSNAEAPLLLKAPDKPLSPEAESRNIWVQVMGVTGAGKTTLVEMLGKKLGLTVLKEPNFAEDPLFHSYYDNPQEFSLPFQMMVLYKVHKQLVGAEEIIAGETVITPGISDLLKAGPIISEPPVPAHRLYATARFGDNPQLVQKYEDWYNGLFGNRELQKPDLLVYLRVSFERMLARIADRAVKDTSRGRELQEKPEYWKRLWDLHEQWIRDNAGNYRILTINTDILDFNKFTKEEDGKEALIREFLNQARYHCIDSLTDKAKLPKDIIIPEAIANHRPSPLTYRDRVPGRRVL